MPAHVGDARQIFLDAVESHAPQQWPEFLDSACHGDAELRARVEALLQAHGQYNAILDGEGFVATLDKRVSERPGEQIGPYKLLQQIGEGGFGVVFLAEQTAPVRRKVALKVIKPGMDTRQVIARFEAERQALAVMDHPNIARVFDAGTTESERPYFVMELVRGVPITAYCDEHNLPVRERLSLFATVCQAIQHAHTKGIIHRDIKPSNVLVTQQEGRPVVKVIDFGIAKAMGQQLTDKTLFTEFAQIIGTPLYMSPEQAELSSVDIDTRSDIYSLGVLLYELLTGTTPVDKEQLKKAALDEIRRIIREEDPPKPSTRISTAEAAPSIAARRQTEPARLSKLVRGELDWIVMKALEKDRIRRYETASGFAADIERYLNDEAVHACPPSTSYRFRKTVRRHKAALAMTGVVVAALLLTMIGLAVSNVLVRAERNEKIAALGQKETALGEKVVALKEAKRQEGLAKTSAQDARKQQRIAEEQEKLARRRYYAAQMNLAMQAWKEGQPARVLQLLESQRPRFDEDDLRGFDWYYLWRLCQGNYRYSLARLNYDNASAIAISSQGATLATVFGANVRLWDSSTGRQIGELRGRVNYVSGLAFSPDGQTLASADGSETVTLWDVATQSKRATIEPGQRVACLQFTGDGRSLVLSGKRVQIWDLAAKGELATLGESGAWFQFVAATPDGAVVAVSGNDSVRIWRQEGRAWREAPPLAGVGYYPRVAISADGKLLAVGANSLKLYHLPSLQERTALVGHTGAVFAVQFTADGKHLVSAGMDRTVRMWDVATGRQEACIAQPGPIYGLALLPDDGVATMSADAVRVLDIAPPAPASVLPHLTAVDAVTFSPDGKVLASRGTNETKLWDVAEERIIATLATPTSTSWLRSLAFSPDGQSLAIPAGNTVDLLSLSGQRLAALPCEASVHGVAYSPDGTSLAAATRSGVVEVWDVPSEQRRYATPRGNCCIAVAFSPDGRTLAAGYQFGVVKLFDVSSGRELSTLQRFELAIDWAFSPTFSPDSRKLATGNAQGLVRIWDIATQKLDATLVGHTNAVKSLTFLDGGRTLATASEDRSVRLWEVATAQERIALEGHTAPVTGVIFSKKGSVLATSSQDGSVRLWRAATDEHARAAQWEADSEGALFPVTDNELGDRLWQMSRVDEAESAYRRALERLEKLLAAFPEEDAYAQETIRSLLSIGVLLKIERGDHPAAEAARRRAIDIYRKLSPQEQYASLIIFAERRRKLHDSGAVQQAERTFSQMIEFMPPDDAAWLRRAAQHLAVCSDPRLRDPARAVELARQAVALSPHDRKELAAAHTYLGIALESAGRRGDAVEPYRNAVAVWQELSEEDPTNEWYRQERAHFNLSLANVLHAGGQDEAALEPCRLSVHLHELLASDFPTRPHYAERLGHARSLLISLFSTLGHDEEAVEAAREQERFAEAQALRAANQGETAPPQPPEERGWTLLNEEKFVEAEAAFREAIQLRPEHAPPHRGLGKSLQKQNKIPEAIAEFREAIQLNPAEFGAHDNLGWILLEQQLPTAAEAAFRNAVRIQPALVSGHVGLGRALREQARFSEAVVPLREAVRLDPNHSYARELLGWVLLGLKQYVEAEIELREWVRLSPSAEWGRVALAESLRGQKKYAEAMVACREGIELAPDNHGGYLRLGWTLLDLEQFAEAESAFREVVRLQPDFAAGHFELGKALLEQKKFVEAVAELREALRLDPAHPWARERLGKTLIESGKLAETETEDLANSSQLAAAHVQRAQAFHQQKKLVDAEAALREAIRLAPEHLWAHGHLGWVLIDQQKFSEAEPEFREAMRLTPDRASIHRGLGKALQGQKKPAEAIACFREAVRLDPNDAPAHDALAWALLDQERPAEAEVEFRECIRLPPERAAANFGLGRALFNQEKFAEAEMALREALRLDPAHRSASSLLAQTLDKQSKPSETDELPKSRSE